MHWTLAKLNSLISDQVEESLTLEYKAAGSLARTDSKKAEITKDVSSFANAAGGTIIYGIMEHDEAGKKHLPRIFDPIDRLQFSKEWLEQVINNIRPRIDSIVIHPVAETAEPTRVIYVVEIPQGTTAHQALDFRYYKRFNFESVPMHDYEIRDILARTQHPVITLEFEIVAESHVKGDVLGMTFPIGKEPTFYDTFDLQVRARNSGAKYAQFVNAILKIPEAILRQDRIISIKRPHLKDAPLWVERFIDNTRRDVIDFKGGSPSYGPSRHEPILPKLCRKLEDIGLTARFDSVDKSGLFIEWSVYADNAPPVSDKIAFVNIPFSDSRHQPSNPET